MTDQDSGQASVWTK